MSGFSLAGWRALVTGAGAGIGRAIAVALIGCEARHFDLSDPLAARDVFAGRGIDVLINNAGIIRRADALAFTGADWDAVMDVGLKAVFFTSQAFARAVLARGEGASGSRAKIVNTSSLLSFQGGIRVPSHTASRHGVAGLTRLLANEWAKQGINVNALAPGYVETANTANLRADPDRSAAILARTLAGRWGRPEDIAGAAVFLASPAANYIHGAILNVDGGWLAR